MNRFIHLSLYQVVATHLASIQLDNGQMNELLNALFILLHMRIAYAYVAIALNFERRVHIITTVVQINVFSKKITALRSSITVSD